LADRTYGETGDIAKSSAQSFYTNPMDALPVLTTEIMIVMLIVGFAVFIFATELLRPQK
jgi:hypothetical protein